MAFAMRVAQEEVKISRFDALKAIYDLEKDLLELERNFTDTIKQEMNKQLYKRHKEIQQLRKQLLSIEDRM
ncbi:hypothetical protein [Salirhabdus sp. Marseille-P4669]|uniref:hypothetical protein n=1 Tax=Salirhabdus sp. Marseille-P4669 TaxID=2042310 RepID=UPI000C7B91F8|nr:hypothetical protein [Salirhabdus sp. Marseille-P4669]